MGMPRPSVMVTSKLKVGFWSSGMPSATLVTFRVWVSGSSSGMRSLTKVLLGEYMGSLTTSTSLASSPSPSVSLVTTTFAVIGSEAYLIVASSPATSSMV